MTSFLRCSTLLAGLGVAGGAAAQDTAADWRSGYTLYGDTGLIEMPSADLPSEGEIAVTLGGFSGQQRFAFTFQITERLSGTFRYARIDEFEGPGTDSTFDRSFDLSYRLLDEGRYAPAVTVGLRDFLGTGLYTSEYIVATKGFGPRLRATAGLGFGRLGSEGGFANPFGLDDRPENEFLDDDPDNDEGGNINGDVFFRGDAALFGGVEYRLTDAFTVLAEYSSDAYEYETGKGVFEHESPFNFGVEYNPRGDYALTLAWLHGSEIALGASFMLNPADRPSVGGAEPAPIPVAARPDSARAAATWDRAALPEAALRDVLRQTLAAEGIRLVSVELGDRSARLRYVNDRYRAEAQAMGRIVRILTQVLPPSIETFTLEPVREGIPVASVSFSRADIEELESTAGAAEEIYRRAVFADASAGGTLVAVADPRPPFRWGIRPYFGATVFDSDQPIAVELGLEFSAEYRIQPGLFLTGVARTRLVGNREEADSISPTGLPQVRTLSPRYFEEGENSIERLTLTQYARPGRDLYSRVTVGYLERMYGGLSTELLWKPVQSRLAFGAELNYARQRDFDLGFGFRDYDVVTGHASAYYDFGNGFHTQLDVGRYLAGDWGATVSVDRQFENGWSVGAYVTRTDAAFEDFGEGSFDKGVSFTVPVDWLLGQPTRRSFTQTLTSLNRDGGARLRVGGRLYDVVRDAQGPDLEASWGRFWR